MQMQAPGVWLNKPDINTLSLKYDTWQQKYQISYEMRNPCTWDCTVKNLTRIDSQFYPHMLHFHGKKTISKLVLKTRY